MDKKPKILIVDDEEKNLMLLEGILLPQGYETVRAKDGEAALEAVRSSSPDVVLLDVMMPKMNGIEVCRRIKQSEETQMIPVVIVTALDGRKDRIEGIEAGADDFLTKPVDATELTIRVKNLLKVKKYHDHIKSYNEILENDVAARTRDLKEANETVKESYLDTIYRLSVAAEYKDEETGQHILRMSRSSAAVAKKMGLPSSEVEKMLYASPMHDVGKIGIPDKILLKPAKLDAEEWKIMKQHTTIGARILAGSGSGLLRMAESIALSHHEKFDGSGYPGGLSGEQIPLEGRITAIADVFDALTSKRPYKPAFSIEKSVDIIKDSVGTHFDPKVVEAFFEVFDEIMNIIRGVPDEEAHDGI